MDFLKRVSRILSLPGTLVNSQHKDAPGDESTDRDNPRKASTSTPAVKGLPESFHSFEKLPLELRNRVYELSLCRGKVFVKADRFCDMDSENQLQTRFSRGGEGVLGPAYDSRGKMRPRHTQLEEDEYDISPKCMGLLQGVSKSVQVEAEQIFYGPKNHFVLPAGIYSHPKTSGQRNRNEYSTRLPQIPPFKSITYTFDMRDVHLDAWTLREEIKEELGADFEKNTFLEVLYRTHDLGSDYLVNVWSRRCRMMRRQLALKFLQIDFEECYCPSGCCRMVLDVCQRLGPFKSGFPDKFEVIGVKDKDEAARIRAEISSLNRAHKVNPRDIRCVDLDGQSIDYEAPAYEARAPTERILTLKMALKPSTRN